jgi:hypothetical protein
VHNLSNIATARICEKKGKFYIVATSVDDVHHFPQVSQPAIERNEDRCDEYQILVALNYLPEQLVFVDEAGCNRNTTIREYGWAPVGSCARRHDYFVQGKR